MSTSFLRSVQSSNLVRERWGYCTYFSPLTGGTCSWCSSSTPRLGSIREPSKFHLVHMAVYIGLVESEGAQR